MSSVTNIQLELIRQAIAQAMVTHPVFSEKYHDFQSIASLRDFDRVPLTSKAELQRISLDLLRGPVPPYLVGLTSGTTYGSGQGGLLFKIYGRNEVAAATELLDAMQSRIKLPHHRLLRVINSNHGLDLVGPREGLIALPLEQPYHVAAITQILRMEFSLSDFTDRVCHLVAPLNSLKALTLRLIEDSVGAGEFAIGRVTSFAWRMSPRWRTLLAKYWKVIPDNLYAISEVPGLHGHLCHFCHGFHFDSSAYIEFISLDSEIPAEHVGRLVVTAFPPLTGMMPIIRYDTEDIFRIKNVCRATAKRGYEYLGKQRDVFSFGANGITTSAGEISDVLDDFEGIDRTIDTRGTALGLSSSFGSPKFRWQVTQTSILEISVAVNFSVVQFQERCDILRDTIKSRIVALLLATEKGLVCPSDIIVKLTNEKWEPVLRKL